MKLRTLIHLVTREAAPEYPGGVRGIARRAAEAVRQDPRLQEVSAGLRGRVQELRGTARTQADLHLERLIASAHTRQGTAVPGEVTALLNRRREEREARARQLRARAALIALGEGPEQRRVLSLLAEATPWTGGTRDGLRYTRVLDLLAPSGDAATEMRVHRALWTLAERRVLAVGPHGTVTACPLPEALPVKGETS